MKTDDYAEKPIEPDLLLRKVGKLIADGEAAAD